MDKRWGIVVLVLLLSSAVFAHQPRVVLDAHSSFEEPISIDDPNISKAYYGELKGAPDYYVISSDVPFRLYVNILTPDIEGYNRTDFSVEVSYGTMPLMLLDGTKQAWSVFYEEYGQDYYLKGPEETADLPEGVYYIKVYSSDNTGRYSLAVGEEESFSAGETLNALVQVPVIKQGFFGKDFLESHMNMSGLVLLGLPLAAILLMLFLIVKVKKRRKKKKD
jgi:hypothetical protein